MIKFKVTSHPNNLQYKLQICRGWESFSVTMHDGEIKENCTYDVENNKVLDSNGCEIKKFFMENIFKVVDIDDNLSTGETIKNITSVKAKKLNSILEVGEYLGKFHDNDGLIEHHVISINNTHNSVMCTIGGHFSFDRSDLHLISYSKIS